MTAQSSATATQLLDITVRTGIHFDHMSTPEARYIVESMSGGVAFVLDLWGRFAESDERSGLCNTEMVGLETLEAQEDIALVRRLLRQHLEWTGSRAAHRVLSHWQEYAPRFVKVMPNDLRHILQTQQTVEINERAV